MSWPVYAETEEEVDYLALATVMLRDGHLQRASTALTKVDPKAEGVDAARYYTLSGIIEMRQENFLKALDAFDAAVTAGRNDSEIHLSRARCAYGAKNCETVLSALDLAGDRSESEADFFVMRSECAWELNRKGESLALLARALVLFPKQRAFGRQRIQRLLDLGLYNQAAAVGSEFIRAAERSTDDILFLAEALIRSGQEKKAIPVLEGARLEFPDEVRFTVQLAHAWMAANHPMTAGNLFLEVSLLDEAFARDAAEVFRDNGMPHRALRANARILDQKIKLKQRVAILIDLERFEAVAALEPRLSRVELLEDNQELRYALAYAFYQVGEHRKAEKHLQKLTEPALFARAGSLRKAMADCRRSKTCD